MDLAFFVTAFATLFVIMDPIGVTPIFIALTRGEDDAHRRAVAIRGCVVAAVVLSLFAFLGEELLGTIGIGMPAFRIAGGVVLFLTALDMLFERRTKRRSSSAEADEDKPDPSVFPIAIPLLAGPGSITSIILLSGQGDGWLDTLAVLGVMALVLVIALALLLTAGPIERGLGVTGITVVTRLLGMILAALSVQFVIDGLLASGLYP
ncbi:MarC family protein [Litorisediminicola beolgyonensis]|uniref:UPF0056 membrane protein n=1 Tax=Litorisediminicola beolgyonensis TaxID=1173614 RepID=A0ABW3ZKT7_9RHOB